MSEPTSVSRNGSGGIVISGQLGAKSAPVTVGRIVHYYPNDRPGDEFIPEPRAAIITATHKRETPRGTEISRAVDLAIFEGPGFHTLEQVAFNDSPKPDHWTFPPRI